MQKTKPKGALIGSNYREICIQDTIIFIKFKICCIFK